MGSRTASVLGKLFRRLADFLDDQGGTAKKAPNLRREVDIITLGLVFLGLIIAGTWLHGWGFFGWNFLFALVFCAGAWVIFQSARWKKSVRAFLLVVILLLSVGSAAERIFALVLLVLLAFSLLRALPVHTGDFIRRELVSVLAVALFCFVSYDAFAGVLEWRRSDALVVAGRIKTECSAATGGTLCRASETSFSVPEFWRPGPGSNLIKDLAPVTGLRIYADSATDNAVAFAAFSAPAHQVMRQVTEFLSLQKGFLRSRGFNKDALVPQQMMKSADTWLYGLRYRSPSLPGYLSDSSELTALLLLHERRGITWLFIIDGTDISAREFILHRIISGFR